MNEEEIIHRLRNAVMILSEGHSFIVGDLTLHSKSKYILEVKGWTSFYNIENITKHSALTELEETKNQFTEMIKISNDLATFVKGREIEYSLGLDYGKGSIPICREINGNLFWESELSK